MVVIVLNKCFVELEEKELILKEVVCWISVIGWFGNSWLVVVWRFV